MGDKSTTATGGVIGLVLLTVLGVTYLPRQGAESTPATETKKAAATKASGGAAKSNQNTDAVGECQEIFGYIKRFYGDGEYYPASCFPQTNTENHPQKAPPDHPDLNFVIAIVPNPVQTHLPLEFDRAVGAIQQAAQDEGYTYDGSWFPWDDSVKDRDSLDDDTIAKDLEEKEHRQPGVLVFRRGLSISGEQKQPYSGGLVVFLVGEQPTGGIDDIQFEHALQWMSTLQTSPNAKTLRILGPTFTGSLLSLARELKVQTIQPYTDGVQILSGSVTSDTGVREFRNFLVSLGKAAGMPGLLEFRTFSEGDALMTNRFLCYLWHGGYDLRRVAILSEDQTAFGRQSWHREFLGRPPDGKPDDVGLQCGNQPIPEYESVINLYYPRDIASLRSAYEKQSIFSAGKQQAGANAPSTMLRGDLSESPSSEHDAVRSYAGQLTPLDQEAVLFGITNILDNKQVEFVIVRSSNSLDQLFLSEFLRRTCPGARVVIAGSDLLLRRGMQGASLRGVMLLSTYPLLGWTQDAGPVFRDRQSGSYRVFGQDVTEGLYIAARELFPPPGASVQVPVSDYAPPLWAARGKARSTNKDLAEEQAKDEKRPATWVSVVGHRQFWPVAVLNSSTEPEPPTDKSLLDPNKTEEYFPEQNRRPQLPGEMVGLLAFLLMLGVWHAYCCRKGSIIGSPRSRAYFAPIPRIQHVILIFAGSLLIGLLGVLLLFVLRSSLGLLAPLSAAPAFLTGAALVVLGFLACVANYRLPVLSPDISTNGSIRIIQWRRRAVRLWLPLLIVLALLYYYFVFSHLNASNLFPTFWRNVFLRSGVSGLLPQVLLLLGLYGWFWSTLQGLSLFGADRSVLPGRDQLPEFEVPSRFKSDEQVEKAHNIKAFRMFSQEDAGEPIESAALPLSSDYLKSLAVFGLVTVLASYLALGEFGLRSLGDRHFGALIFLGACLCIAMILTDALQFLRTWSRLRQLLNFLDRLRLRRTLDALKGLSWDSVWKMSGNVLEQRYLLISRQFESMRNLTNLLETWSPKDPEEIKAKDAALAQLKTCATQGARFADWYVNLCDPDYRSPVADITPLKEFQEELAATAACVMKQIIFPAWNKETESLLIAVQQSGDVSEDNDEKDNQHADHARKAVKAPVQAAEEFFVLPYLGFIQNTIGRIRSIAISMLALFVAATLAVSSYPFDPLPAIGAIFLITFVLIGVTTVFVYAEMHRDATLSRITNKRPGELGFDFWAKLVAFGIGPLIGLLTTLFPSMTDFIVSFLQPGAQAIK